MQVKWSPPLAPRAGLRMEPNAGGLLGWVKIAGHYDSRNSDPLDRSGVAPGANDDASGTAVSLEWARVFSKLKFPATIIFLTVAGEEQGLYGSKHFAEFAKSQGWEIEAVLMTSLAEITVPGRTRRSCGSFPKVFLTGRRRRCCT